MNPELLSIVKPLVEKPGYKGGRDSLFTLLLAGGVWLATEVRRDAEDIRKAVARIEQSHATLETRVAALERNR